LTSRTHCIRCGTCCQKGGPTLHNKDKKLILEGHIGFHHLVTIRKGEPAFNPLSNQLEPVKHELVKIAGKGKTWTCIFYDEKKTSCSIYKHRPLECRLLTCWDTSKILLVIGKDTLTRTDIINPSDLLLKLVKAHEKKCSVTKTMSLIASLKKEKDDPQSPAKLKTLFQQDMDIRTKAVSEFKLSLAVELFYFGRPLFKIMNSYIEQVNSK
jgi:Fe-S-cluster containining protein